MGKGKTKKSAAQLEIGSEAWKQARRVDRPEFHIWVGRTRLNGRSPRAWIEPLITLRLILKSRSMS